MAPACLSNECEEIERCRMACEADFFFRMGFLSINDEDVDKRLGGGEFARFKDFLESECSGPYSQVTSQSFSLSIVSQ
jgi:hypothetical protein